MHSENLLYPPHHPNPHLAPSSHTHHGCALVQVREGGGDGCRAMLFPLVRRFRLLPLNHAAAHDAVEAPQVEEGDGAKQPHGDDLSSTLCETLWPKVQTLGTWTCQVGWRYLLKAFRNGGDRWHSTGDGRQHVAVRAHRAVEIPLLHAWGGKKWSRQTGTEEAFRISGQTSSRSREQVQSSPN